MSKSRTPNHDDRTETGETYKQCPVTGQWHRVTEWIEKDGGRIVAVEKEPVDEADVPRGER